MSNFIYNILFTIKLIFMKIMLYILHKNLNSESENSSGNEYEYENEFQITIYDDII